MYRFIALKFSLALVLFAACFSPFSANAQEAAALGRSGIGVLDLELVIQQSDAGKGIREALNVKEVALRKESDGYKKSLREKEQKLLSDRKGGMDDKAFEAAKKSFEDEFKKSQKAVIEKNSSIEKSRVQALKDIQEHIGKITADVADERKLQIVVDRKFVVIAEKDLDITNEVLKRLNEAVKTIPLK